MLKPKDFPFEGIFLQDARFKMNFTLNIPAAHSSSGYDDIIRPAIRLSKKFHTQLAYTYERIATVISPQTTFESWERNYEKEDAGWHRNKNSLPKTALSLGCVDYLGMCLVGGEKNLITGAKKFIRILKTLDVSGYLSVGHVIVPVQFWSTPEEVARKFKQLSKETAALS